MSRNTLAGTLAWVGLLAAAGAMLFLALWPYTYTGSSVSQSGAVHETHASLIEENGTWVLLPLAVPVLLAIVGLVASRSSTAAARVTMLAAALVLLALCLTTALTVGTFFLPAAMLLLGAGLLHKPRPAAPSVP